MLLVVEVGVWRDVEMGGRGRDTMMSVFFTRACV